MATDFAAIGKQFADFYYETFDRNRAELAPLYREISMLTFEGAPNQGAQAIVQKLSELPFTQVKHQISTTDIQPTGEGRILVSITGMLVVDGGANPLQFNQVFHLVPEGSTYFVLNDIFRLNLG